MKLVKLIFHQAQQGDWQCKKASLFCYTLMMAREILLSYLSKEFTPNAIAVLCYDSIQLPDSKIQEYVIKAILCVVCMEPEIYAKEFVSLEFDSLSRKV
jgi:hypothetical protein